MDYIIDSYAWVEYFIGSKKGEILKKLLSDEENNFFTIECCLAELRGWSIRNNQNFRELLEIVRANSLILKISEADWISAGEEGYNQKRIQRDFGLIDSTLLIKQKELHCKIITGDQHFKNMKNIVFIS